MNNPVPLTNVEKEYMHRLLTLCNIEEALSRMTLHIVEIENNVVQYGIGGYFLNEYFRQVKNELDAFGDYMKNRKDKKHKFETFDQFFQGRHEPDLIIFLEDLLDCGYLIEVGSVLDMSTMDRVSYPPPKFDSEGLYAFDKEICMQFFVLYFILYI